MKKLIFLLNFLSIAAGSHTSLNQSAEDFVRNFFKMVEKKWDEIIGYMGGTYTLAVDGRFWGSNVEQKIGAYSPPGEIFVLKMTGQTHYCRVNLS